MADPVPCPACGRIDIHMSPLCPVCGTPRAKPRKRSLPPLGGRTASAGSPRAPLPAVRDESPAVSTPEATPAPPSGSTSPPAGDAPSAALVSGASSAPSAPPSTREASGNTPRARPRPLPQGTPAAPLPAIREDPPAPFVQGLVEDPTPASAVVSSSDRLPAFPGLESGAAASAATPSFGGRLAVGAPSDTPLPKLRRSNAPVQAKPGSFAPSYIGRTLAGYRLEELLGEGSMGAVFLATQLQLHRSVALKILPPAMSARSSTIDRFKREARTLARINHHNIVHIYDLCEDNGLFCIAMGLVDGGSVRDLLKKEGTLAEWRAARIARQAAHGLFAAAKQDIVHQDIKPDNLLIGEQEEVKIADFGLAQVIDDEGSGKIMGSPSYMAPEAWQGRPDQRSDLYSLGCTLYEMLVGHPPFRALSNEGFRDLHRDKPPPPLSDKRPDCSPAMNAVIARLLQKDPAVRYQTAAELADALKPLCVKTEIAAREPAPRRSSGRTPGRSSQRPRRPRTSQRTRRPGFPLWPLAVVALVVIVLALALTRDPPPPVVRFAAIEPASGTLLAGRNVLLKGRLEGDADGFYSAVDVGGEPVRLGRDGSFQRTLRLREGVNLCELRVGREKHELVYTVDSEPPELRFLVPAEDGAQRALHIELRMLVSDAGGLEEVLLNGERPRRLGGDTLGLRVELAPGPNALELVARDRAGHERRMERTLVADTAAPQLQAALSLDGTRGSLRVEADEPLARVAAEGIEVRADGAEAELLLVLAPDQPRVLVEAWDRVGNRARLELAVPWPEVAVEAPEPWWDPPLLQEAAALGADRGVVLRNSVGVDFVLIPAGSFFQGSLPEEEGRGADERWHRVELDGFYLAAREIDQQVWRMVMASSPSAVDDPTRPVEQISWREAVEFCNRLSELEDLAPAYAIEGDSVRWLEGRAGYRLPTEAEWEYACRAATETPYASGDTLEQANFAERSGATLVGGSFPPNAWGLFDMHGNVHEWCWDWYGPYPEDDVQNPRGATQGRGRVARGGGFRSQADACRSAARTMFVGERRDDLGLRILRPLP